MFLAIAVLFAGAASGAGDRDAADGGQTGRTIVLGRGKLQARIPRSAESNLLSVAPGPVISLARKPESAADDSAWIGDSRLFSPHHSIERLTTRQIEGTPAVEAFELVYEFGNGGSYRVTVRSEAGHDFIEYDEEIVGLSAGDDVRVEMAWVNFSPTFRVFPTVHGQIERGMIVPLDRPLNGSRVPHWNEDPAVEMAGRLIPSNPIDKLGSYAAFRDVNTEQALGLFSRAAWHQRPANDLLSPFRQAPPVTFRYANGSLQWVWPLATGRRFTALVHSRDRPASERTVVAELSDEYGGIHPDRAGDWILSYPEDGRRPQSSFPGGPLRRPLKELLKDITGRNVYLRLMHGYGRSLSSMSNEARSTVDKHILRSAYACSEQPFMNMVTGNGRFTAGEAGDQMCILPAAAFFLPEHPMACEWLDQYEKFIELTTLIKIEKGEPGDHSRGGAWRGGAICGVWEFLRSVTWGNYAAIDVDGRNRAANPWMAGLADWLAGNLSAPVSGRRLLPPWGAAGNAAAGKPPFEMWMLGQWLRRYRPVTAEHIMWGSSPAAVPFDRAGIGWRSIHPADDRTLGTAPKLESSKFAGIGVAMRAAAGSPGELSLHISQLGGKGLENPATDDESGAIYYYADGTAYSGRVRMRRDRGGHFLSNLSVWKEGRYRTIGGNADGPRFHDLQVAQFAELLPREGDPSSVWPEYRGRSVLLVGADYFLLLDAVGADVRSQFTWTVPRDAALPFIRMLRGAEGAVSPSSPPGSRIYVRQSEGGDSLALVSHRRDLVVKPKSYGCRVRTPEAADYVFFGSKSLEAKGWGYRFDGRTGVIRKTGSGGTEFAICGSGRIGDGTVMLEIADSAAGMSLTYEKPPECSGWYSAGSAGKARLTFKKEIPANAWFYVDGNLTAAEANGRELAVQLPGGTHRWQITSGRPEPVSPTVIRTVNSNGAATVYFAGSTAADSYDIELSRDNGRSWEEAGEVPSGSRRREEYRYELGSLSNGSKVHVRVIAVNPAGAGVPSEAYPIYVTDRPPLPPDGLRCLPMNDRARLSWGEVLGAGEYSLYRRPASGAEDADWTRVYRGRAFTFEDGLAGGVIPAFAAPGPVLNADRKFDESTVYEYAVSSVNGNGEGEKCRPVTTHPASWLHWYPSEFAGE